MAAENERLKALLDEMAGAITNVMNYRRGLGEYDFSKVEPQYVGNELHDAWARIERMLITTLAQFEQLKSKS